MFRRFWKNEEWIKIFINGRMYFSLFLLYCLGFPDGSNNKMSTCNAWGAGEAGSTPGLRRCPGGGNNNPLQYSCSGNPMDGESWWAIVHGVAKNWAWLNTWWVDELYFMALFIQNTCTSQAPTPCPSMTDSIIHKRTNCYGYPIIPRPEVWVWGGSSWGQGWDL